MIETLDREFKNLLEQKDQCLKMINVPKIETKQKMNTMRKSVENMDKKTCIKEKTMVVDERLSKAANSQGNLRKKKRTNQE